MDSHNSTPRKPLRLWPGVVAVVALWLARFGLKAVIPGFAGFRIGMMWAFGGVLAVVVWWMFFSRARWSERLGAIVLMIAALFGTWQLRHESMGPLWLVGYAVPFVCLALVAGAIVGRRLADGPRRATIAASIVLASGMWTFVRTEGISGDHVAQFRWRWTESAEERLRAQAGDNRPAPPPAATPELSTPSVATKAADTPAAPSVLNPAKAPAGG